MELVKTFWTDRIYPILYKPLSSREANGETAPAKEEAATNGGDDKPKPAEPKPAAEPKAAEPKAAVAEAKAPAEAKPEPKTAEAKPAEVKA